MYPGRQPTSLAELREMSREPVWKSQVLELIERAENAHALMHASRLPRELNEIERRMSETGVVEIIGQYFESTIVQFRNRKYDLAIRRRSDLRNARRRRAY